MADAINGVGLSDSFDPLSAYDEYGRRVKPPKYTRAEMNAMAEAARKADPNVVRGAIYDAVKGMGGDAGAASLASTVGSFMPVVGDLQDAEDSARAFKSGDYLTGALLAGALLAPGAAGALVKGGKKAAKGAAKTVAKEAAQETGERASRLNVNSLLRSEDGQANAVKSYLDGGFKPSDAPVKVAITPDGKPYLVDGYHRAEWALRDGDGTVPVEYVDFDKIKTLYDNERSFLPAQDALQPKGIRAYHGSPHDFDRFDMSKIGTGEGAQAYGHGLYFADSEDVARSYRDTLSQRGAIGAKNIVRPDNVSDDEFNVVSSSLGRFWGRWDPSELVGQMRKRASEIDETRRYVSQLVERRKELRDARPDLDDGMFAKMDEGIAHYQNAVSQMEEYQKAANIIESRGGIDAFVPKGRMYEVNINANPDDFLDWDKPFSQQPQVEKLVQQWVNKGQIFPPEPEETAGQVVKGLYGGDWQQKEFLRAGIPGIKYLDGMSRSAGEGSRNYVVFDDALIEIVRKYGIAAAVASGVISEEMARQMQAQGDI